MVALRMDHMYDISAFSIKLSWPTKLLNILYIRFYVKISSEILVERKCISWWISIYNSIWRWEVKKV